MQAQIAALLAQRDAAQEKQIASLVKTYSAMKPKDAPRIFDTLNDEVLVPVAQEMKSDALAPVLAAMNPEAAQKLTVKLASGWPCPTPTAAPRPPRPWSRPACRYGPGLTPRPGSPTPGSNPGSGDDPGSGPAQGLERL